MRSAGRFALALAVGAVTFLPSVAFAVAPVDLDRNYEDHAQVSSEAAKLSNMMVEVSSGNLWVVTVDDFDGLAPDNWTTKTFEKSGLRAGDGLLAISVGTSELYAYSPDGSIKELLNNATSQDVLDKFHDGDWDGGIALFGEHVRQLRSGGAAPQAPGGTSAPNVLPVVGVLGLAGAGVAGFAYRKKKKAAVAQGESLAELAKKASGELLAADDDVRSGITELEFARAEFGVGETREFTDSLAQAQAQVKRAFDVRRLLDDDDPETPEEQRQMNTEILQLASSAREAMRAQAEKFSQMRDLAGRLGAKLSDLAEREQEIRSSLALAKDKITNLAYAFPRESLTTLSSYPAQVASLLSAAQEHLASARRLEAGGDKNQGVQYARLAEGALDQAAQLMDRIDKAPQMLENAREQLARGIASLSSDIADAKRLGGGDSTIALRQKEAEAVVARATAGESVDLILMNDQLAEAESNLDMALAGVRAADEQATRVRANLDRFHGQISAKLDRLDEDVTRYRELVSAETRTLLQRAHSALTSVESMPASEQLAGYSSAMDYATRAERALSSDIADYRNAGQHSSKAELGGELAGAILTGVARSLIYGAFSGGSSRHNSWGNNSFGSGGGFNSGGGFGSGGGGFGKSF
ncbi:TPM domain-containing protein [Arcanobacterium haemolyticum]